MGYFFCNNAAVDSIGMAEAGKRVGITREAIRRVLQEANIPLTLVGRSMLVEEKAFDDFVMAHGGYESFKRGRPTGSGKEVSRKEELASEV